MSNLMQKAIAEMNELPEQEQDSLGAWLLAELASERRWSELFAASQDLLSDMADEALAERRTGKTLPLDPDTL